MLTIVLVIIACADIFVSTTFSDFSMKRISWQLLHFKNKVHILKVSFRLWKVFL